MYPYNDPYPCHWVQVLTGMGRALDTHGFTHDNAYQDLIIQLQTDVAEAEDNFLQAKYSKHIMLIKTDPSKYLSKLVIR